MTTARRHLSETPQHAVDPATLAPGSPVEIADDDDWPRLAYAHPDRWRLYNDSHAPYGLWDDWRIVRVLGDVTPWWPVIAPEDMKPGMRIRAVHESGAVMEDVSGDGRFMPNVAWGVAALAHDGWTLHVHPDDAPDPAPDPDPDAALVEAMARAMVEEVVTHEPEPWERAIRHRPMRCLRWAADGIRERLLHRSRSHHRRILAALVTRENRRPWRCKYCLAHFPVPSMARFHELTCPLRPE